ncbi:MAG TPA: methyl-accepting chemotaxis protein [Clostridia bacterium]|nr:methyl-accepting chemotaxis protein [Clostridia bacterium]
MKVKNSIKKRMILTILLPLIIIASLALYFNYNTYKNSAYEQAALVSEGQSIESADLIEDMIENDLSKINESSIYLSTIEMIVMNNRENLLETTIEKNLSLSKNIDEIWVELYNPVSITGNSNAVFSSQKENITMNRSSNTDENDFIKNYLKTNDSFVSDPYLKDDVMYFTYAESIINASNEEIGYIAGIYNLSTIQSFIEKERIYERGFMRVLSYNGTVAAHKSFDRVNKFSGELDDQGQGDYLDYIQKGTLDTGIYYSFAIDKNTFKSIAPIEIGNVYWSVGTIIEEEEIMADTNRRMQLMITFGALMILVVGTLIIYETYKISKPIKLVTEKAYSISNFDLTQKIPEKLLNRSDEVGILANSLNNIIENLTNFVENSTNQSRELVSYSDKLAEISEQSLEASTQIAYSVEEIANGATEQSEDTYDTVNNMNAFEALIDAEQEKLVQLNQASMEVLTLKEDGIKNITNLVQKNKETVASSKNISEVIQNTNDNAKKIDEAVKMIKSISEQTNLLALNASIEAARAGEAGRGFSVVAEEIRKLAEESDQFSETIAIIVKNLQSEVSQAVEEINNMTTIVHNQSKGVNRTKDKFDGIAKSIEKTTQLIEILTKSSDEMKNKKEDILQSIHNLSEISETNAAATEEVSASVQEQTASMDEIANSSQSLLTLADATKEMINKFKI